MSSARLIERVGDVGVRGVAVLSDYQHRFSKLGSDGTAKGNIEPAPGNRTFGVLYHLSRSQLERLTGFEGGYRRARFHVSLHIESDLLLAHSFVAMRTVEGVAPDETYLDHYRAGIIEHGIDANYLREML